MAEVLVLAEHSIYSNSPPKDEKSEINPWLKYWCSSSTPKAR